MDVSHALVRATSPGNVIADARGAPMSLCTHTTLPAGKTVVAGAA